MGEIGMPRREFLYDIRFWEARRIIRGYRRRNRLTHQLLAEVAYAAIYAMRDPKGKTVTDIFPQLFEEEKDTDSSDKGTITEAERQHLIELMREYNEKSG